MPITVREKGNCIYTVACCSLCAVYAIYRVAFPHLRYKARFSLLNSMLGECISSVKADLRTNEGWWDEKGRIKYLGNKKRCTFI